MIEDGGGSRQQWTAVCQSHRHSNAGTVGHNASLYCLHLSHRLIRSTATHRLGLSVLHTMAAFEVWRTECPLLCPIPKSNGRGYIVACSTSRCTNTVLHMCSCPLLLPFGRLARRLAMVWLHASTRACPWLQGKYSTLSSSFLEAEPALLAIYNLRTYHLVCGVPAGLSAAPLFFSV